MQAESLEVLEKASVAPGQARAIVRAIEIEIAGAKDTLATKHDLLEQRSDTRQWVGELRAEIAKLRAEVQADLAKLRAEVQADLAKLRAEVQADLAELRAELQGDIAKLRGELQAEIHTAVAGSTRQMYMALLGHLTLTLGFIYFLFTKLG